jgi:hypothetical protein
MKFILFFLKFLTLNVVEGEVATDVKTEETTEVKTEEVSAADQAWEAIEADAEEASPEEVALPDAEITEKVETKSDDAKVEEPKKEEGITDDDLKPLESKNPATNERFKKITEGYKEEKARNDVLSQENERYKSSIDSLKQLGFNDSAAAEDLVEFSAYRHTLATGNVEEFKSIIEAQIKQFEQIHGKRVSVSASILDDYPDLLEKVNDLELDEETAIKIAKMNALEQRATRDSRKNKEIQQTEQQKHEVLQVAVNNVTEMQNNWLKNDPDYKVIIPHLQPLIDDIGKKYPPSMWAETLDLNYKALKKALATTMKQLATKDEPLRGNGYMSGKPAPTSVQEATLQAMGFD